MERLKSSFKSLQEAITSLSPIGPICIQESRTQSFRSDPDSISNYAYCATSNSSSLSSFSSSSSFGPSRSHIDEDTNCHVSNSTTMEAIALPGGHISSQRFFFSSHTTRDIMEEFKSKPSLLEEREEEEEEVAKLSFSDESKMMVMASDDPYHDFRASMEEMVEMHKLRDWPQLLELLQCYLKLNEKKTHKVIMLAFVDLLMTIMERDKEAFSASFPLTSYLMKSL